MFPWPRHLGNEAGAYASSIDITAELRSRNCGEHLAVACGIFARAHLFSLRLSTFGDGTALQAAEVMIGSCCGVNSGYKSEQLLQHRRYERVSLGNKLAAARRDLNLSVSGRRGR